MLKTGSEKIQFRDELDIETQRSGLRPILKFGATACILAFASLPFLSINEKNDQQIANFIAETIEPIIKEDPSRLPFCYSQQEFNDMRNNNYFFNQTDGKPVTYIELKLADDKSHIDTVPDKLPLFSDIVADSTVQIKGNGITGSGFVTVNNKNEKVVVTVAHAVDADINKTYIKSADGGIFDVVDGCMIHAKKKGLPNIESTVNMNNPDDNDRNVVDYDVAILKVDKPNDLPEPLKLSDNLVKRGDILYANNFQKTERGNSAQLDEITKQYTIVYNIEPGRIGAIDGLENRQPQDQQEMYVRDRTMGGASGGPVFDSGGRVVGIVYGAEDVKTYRNQSSLQKDLGIIMSQEDSNIIKPGIVKYSDVHVIRQALSAPTIND